MSNRLTDALSPYLLQHAQNPVNWYPWTEEAFEIAKKENKPVLISIGYAACHWCHVMAHESFEDEEIAAYMNQHFINIKVDREEHPDVDHLYMDALQAMTGSGGWPLNMFVTPDKKPFYGGTYFPPQRVYNRSSWLEVLTAIQKTWNENREEVERQAEQMIQHLKQANLVQKGTVEEPQKKILDEIAQQLLQQSDKINGGFGAAPKFLATATIQYLLSYFHFKGEDATLAQESLAQALLTLDKMIDGGIYDQIGGGFSRYSTDNEWLAPHFEKMLYDNALLLAVLSDAYMITGNEKYKEIIEETIEFCTTQLSAETAEQEGFYCALDADSEGVEGKYYTWTYEQVLQAIPDPHPALLAYFDITKAGNWEGVNILNRALHRKELLVNYSLPLTEWYNILNDGKERLLHKRNGRIPPATDDKVLLAWNAMMNIALCKAAKALERKEYLEQAEQHLNWLLRNFVQQDGSALHVHKDGHSYIPGKLDDYAYLIKALLVFTETSGQTKFIKQATSLMQYVQDNFKSENSSFFNYSAQYQKDILVQKVELYDGATPSANSILAETLYLLGTIMERNDWKLQSENMLMELQSQIKRYPSSFSNWAVLLQNAWYGRMQLIFTGKDAKQELLLWGQNYFPEVFVLLLQKENEKELPIFEGKPYQERLLLYLCEEGSCKLPVKTVAEIIKEIKISRENIV